MDIRGITAYQYENLVYIEFPADPRDSGKGEQLLGWLLRHGFATSDNPTVITGSLSLWDLTKQVITKMESFGAKIGEPPTTEAPQQEERSGERTPHHLDTVQTQDITKEVAFLKKQLSANDELLRRLEEEFKKLTSAYD